MENIVFFQNMTRGSPIFSSLDVRLHVPAAAAGEGAAVQSWCKKLTDLDALEMMRTMMHCTVQCTFESNPSLASDPGRPPCPANLDQDIFK